jgi:hypothetical protein
MSVGYLVDFGLDPMRGIENASMKDASELIDRLKKAKEASWPGSRSAASGEKISGARKKTARQLDGEIAAALAGQSSDTGSPFYDFLLERFPSGDVPWSWAKKILREHGVPVPLLPYDDDAKRQGIRPGKPTDVHQLAKYLGY